MNPDRKISEEMQNIAKHVDELLTGIAGQRMGFSLVVFNVVENSRMNYVSNCDRKEVQSALTDLLEGWKKGMPDIPAHEIDG